MKKHYKALFIYLFIFSMICVLLTTFNSRSNTQTTFSNYKPAFSFINRDKETVLTDGLNEYLKDYVEFVPIEDNDEAIKDANFYRGSDYILILPEGFSDYILNGGKPVDAQMIITPDSASGYYLDVLINKYFNTVENYVKSGLSGDKQEIIDMAIQDLSDTVEFEKVTIPNGSSISEAYRSYLRIMGYFLIVIVVLCVSTVFMSFKRPEMCMRNYGAPIRPRSVYLQQVLYVVVISTVIWIVMSMFGLIFLLNGNESIHPTVLFLLYADTFIYTVFAMGLGMLCSSFIASDTVMNAAANIISLGLSFLGGCFVPLELFGETLMQIAQFIPAYWYCSAIDSISSLVTFDFNSMKPILICFGMQLLFAAAAFAVAAAVNTIGVGSEKSYENKRTQLAH